MTLGRPDWRAYPNAPAPGTILCRLDDLADGEARSFDLSPAGASPDDSFAVIVLRRGETVVAYVNDCPHAHTPLDWKPGELLNRAGTHLRCATHGALFRLDNGSCVSGPCRGDHLVPVPAQVIGSLVCIADSTV